MRLEFIAIGILVIAASGCASEKPVFVQLDVKGPPFARATVRQIGAVTDQKPTQCTTPCRLEFAPDVVFDIELEASGYYPALFAIEYATMHHHQKNHDADEQPLVIPMLPHPDQSDE